MNLYFIGWWMEFYVLAVVGYSGDVLFFDRVQIGSQCYFVVLVMMIIIFVIGSDMGQQWFFCICKGFLKVVCKGGIII